MSKNNVDQFFQQQRESLTYRAEYAALELSASLAKQIRIMRLRRQLSQQQMAEKLETKQSQVSRMENPDEARYTLQTLAKIADVLGCKLSVTLQPFVQNSVVTQNSAGLLMNAPIKVESLTWAPPGIEAA
jgi:transcriptional regulator with XRE-family HTH domain